MVVMGSRDMATVVLRVEVVVVVVVRELEGWWVFIWRRGKSIGWRLLFDVHVGWKE